VRQPVSSCNPDIPSCSTTASTYGIVHGALLLLAGHRTKLPSAQRHDT
jgi:hypothetical protein